MRLFRDFPLNFRITTWRLSQWVATITFIVMAFIFKDQYFGNWDEITFTVCTPLGFFALVAILFSQSYVYGGYITNTIKDILVPGAVILVIFILELAISYVARNLGFNAQWWTMVERYTMLMIQIVIQLWVYSDVEFLEIPADEVPGLEEKAKQQ